MIHIKKITWEEILPIWTNELWPMRESAIESTSAMCFFKKREMDESGKHVFNEEYDLKNMEFTPTFWGAFHNDKLVGVNSGHMCLDRLYRSRGLYVLPEYRNRRIGEMLLWKTLAQADHEKALLCWSYMRFESSSTYSKVAFEPKSSHFNFETWDYGETGRNQRVALMFDPDGLGNMLALKSDEIL